MTQILLNILSLLVEPSCLSVVLQALSDETTGVMTRATHDESNQYGQELCPQGYLAEVFQVVKGYLHLVFGKWGVRGPLNDLL